MAKSKSMVGNRLKVIAIFMIILVLSIPFVTAVDYGGSDGQTGGDDVGTGGSNPSGDGSANTDSDDPEVVDNIPPSASITSVVGETVYGPLDYTGVGSLIEVNFVVSDNYDTPNDLGATIEFTSPSGSKEAGSVSCSNGNCVAYSGSVSESGQISFIIKVTDSNNNVGSTSGGIQSAPLLEGNASDLWSSAVTLSPAAWDREVSTYVNQKTYVQITLSDGAQNLYSVDFQSCLSATSTGADSSSRGIEYLQNVTYLSSSDDQLQHFLLLTSKTDDNFNFDNIKINCTFAINSYSRNGFAPHESESVLITIPFYNNPAGMATNVTISKIRSAEDETGGWLETMDDIYEWVKVLEYVCKIYEGIRKVVNLVSVVGGALSAVGTAGENWPIVGPIFKAIKKIGDLLATLAGKMGILTNNKATAYIVPMCKWVNCEFGLFSMLEEWGVDMEFTDYISKYNSPNSLQSDKGNSKLNSALGNMTEAGITIFDTDNIVYQFLNMCIPGLLKKAHEWRAIKCTYVLCLVEQAESGLIDESICETIKNSQECEYLLKIFNFIPFSGLMEIVYEYIQEFWASDIEGKVFMVLTTYCDRFNNQDGGGWQFAACDFVNQVTNVATAIADVQAMFDSKSQYFAYTADNDKACEDMEEAVKAFEDEQAGFGDTTTVVDSSTGTGTGNNYGGGTSS